MPGSKRVVQPNNKFSGVSNQTNPHQVKGGDTAPFMSRYHSKLTMQVNPSGDDAHIPPLNLDGPNPQPNLNNNNMVGGQINYMDSLTI